MVLETERYPKDKKRRWRLVYESDFTDERSWTEHESDKDKCFILDGYLHLVVTRPDHWVLIGPEITVDNFRAQVDIEMNIESGKTADCGLVFQTSIENTNETVYLFSAISRSGFYSLYRENKRGGASMIIGWQESKYIKRGDKANLLMVERIGDSIMLGVNNYIIATAMERGLNSGVVRLFVRTYKNDLNGEAMFKNFLLYSVYHKQGKEDPIYSGI